MLGVSEYASADEVRGAGGKVFHVPIMFKEDASDNPNKCLGILAGCAKDKLFTCGTWNADFHPLMQPQAGDIVVQGKKGLDAFPGTDLESQLVANGIETVVLGGLSYRDFLLALLIDAELDKLQP